VIHIAGKRDYRRIQDQYDQLGIPFALFTFLDRMDEAYHIADLVISRAGAVTVSEIASFRLPAIFVPYPYAQGHQRENASVLCEINAAQTIEDRDLSASKLAETILMTLGQRSDDEETAEKYKAICFSDATQRLAEEALRLAR